MYADKLKLLIIVDSYDLISIDTVDANFLS